MMECCLVKMNYRLEDFTLHRNAMLLIDGVESYDFEEKKISAFAHIDENTLFYENEIDGAYSYMGFELSAQAVSVYIGLEARLLKGAKPEMGFILSLSNLQCHEPVLRSHEPIFIQAWQTHRDVSIAYFDSRVSQSGKIMLTLSFMAMLASSDTMRQSAEEHNA